MSLGQAILRIAERKQLTKCKVAKMSKIPQSTFSDIVTEKTQNPTLETLIKIANGLGVSVSELIMELEMNDKVNNLYLTNEKSMNDEQMNNKIKIFKSDEFGQVRGILIDGEPYLIGKDIVERLGYDKSYSDVIKQHCDAEDYILFDKTHPRNGVEMDYKELGQRGGYLINESALYALIFGSKLPTAKEFKRWVTSEVLPQIRKTGFYGNNKDLLLQFLTQLPQEQIKLIIDTLSPKLLPTKPVKEALYDFLADNLESLSLTIENYVEVNYETFRNYFEIKGYNIDDVLRELRFKNLIKSDAFGFCVKGGNIVIKMTPSLKFYED